MSFKLCVVAIIFALIGCIASENVPSDDQVISMINQLDEEQALPLFGGLLVEKVEGANDASARSESLADRVVRYLKSHKVNFDISEARSSSVGEARGKLKKLLVPILLALKFKSAVILPIVFAVLALISLKALKVGLVALILAGSQFVKDFFAKKQEKITTAYISANPASSGFNAEIVTDWNRNGAASAGGDLAYNAYGSYQAPNYQTLPQSA